MMPDRDLSGSLLRRQINKNVLPGTTRLGMHILLRRWIWSIFCSFEHGNFPRAYKYLWVWVHAHWFEFQLLKVPRSLCRITWTSTQRLFIAFSAGETFSKKEIWTSQGKENKPELSFNCLVLLAHFLQKNRFFLGIPNKHLRKRLSVCSEEENNQARNNCGNCMQCKNAHITFIHSINERICPPSSCWMHAITFSTHSSANQLPV